MWLLIPLMHLYLYMHFDLDVKVGIFAIKIIYLNTKISADKIMVGLVFKIDSNNIYIEIALIKQNIIVLLQTVILKSKIQRLKIIIFLLVFYFIDIIIKEQYF